MSDTSQADTAGVSTRPFHIRVCRGGDASWAGESPATGGRPSGNRGHPPGQKPSPTVADAILDRLLYNAYKIFLRGGVHAEGNAGRHVKRGLWEKDFRFGGVKVPFDGGVTRIPGQDMETRAGRSIHSET